MIKQKRESSFENWLIENSMKIACPEVILITRGKNCYLKIPHEMQCSAAGFGLFPFSLAATHGILISLFSSWY